MVDREARDKMVSLLEGINNRVPNTLELITELQQQRSEDPVIKEVVGGFVETLGELEKQTRSESLHASRGDMNSVPLGKLYGDGECSFSADALRTIERIVLFLKSDTEFQWHKPWWVTCRMDPAFLFWTLVGVIAFVALGIFLESLGLSFGYILPVVLALVYLIHRKWGDEYCWPFRDRAEYEVALTEN